jgi:acetyl esterase/lipase
MSIEWTELEIGGGKDPLPVRVYPYAGKPQALVLYLAGNSFRPRDLSTEEWPAARALSETGAKVIEADYAGRDGIVFPGAVENAFEALKRLATCRKQFAGPRTKLFVAGDEAGGNIAAGVALKARDQMPGELSGQILLSPMLDPQMTSASVRQADEIGMRQRWSEGWSRYLRVACGYGHPYAAPCLCSRMAGVAPALVVTAEDDPLRDEIAAYADRLDQAGVRAHRHVVPAGSGWTGIFKGRDGSWTEEIRKAFSAFLQKMD